MEDEENEKESVVANALLSEDEMIITIEDYQNLKKELDYLREQENAQYNLRQRIREENLELKQENTTLKQENENLKKGIIKVVSIIGGITKD